MPSCRTPSRCTSLDVETEVRAKRSLRTAVPWLLLVSVVLTQGLSGTTARAQTSPATDSGAQPSFVGEATCRACHNLEAEHWSTTIHARIAKNALQKSGCESCHGPGSAHVQDPSNRKQIVSFTRNSNTPVETMNEMCLACHSGGGRIYWAGSMHERQGLACSDCHNPMTRQSPLGLLAERTVSEVCFRCHPSQRSEFRKRSHMPVLEGKIACSDCHQPHGSSTDPLLRADSVNILCTGCHAEKRGPFIWEHAPVVESCLGCHHPHGSNHQALLVAPVPFLCNRCHGEVGSFGHVNDLLVGGNLAGGARPDARILNRGCVNCHAQIHGSNHPSGARFHR